MQGCASGASSQHSPQPDASRGRALACSEAGVLYALESLTALNSSDLEAEAAALVSEAAALVSEAAAFVSEAAAFVSEAAALVSEAAATERGAPLSAFSVFSAASVVQFPLPALPRLLPTSRPQAGPAWRLYTTRRAADSPYVVTANTTFHGRYRGAKGCVDKPVTEWYNHTKQAIGGDL